MSDGIQIVTALITATETQVCVFLNDDGKTTSHLLSIVHGLGNIDERRAAWVAPDGEHTAWKPTPREDIVDWNGTPHTSPDTHLHARLPRTGFDVNGLVMVLDETCGTEAGRRIPAQQWLARTVAVQIGIALWNTGSM